MLLRYVRRQTFLRLGNGDGPTFRPLIWLVRPSVGYLEHVFGRVRCTVAIFGLGTSVIFFVYPIRAGVDDGLVFHDRRRLLFVKS